MKYPILILSLVALFAGFATAQEKEQPGVEDLEKRMREIAAELASEDPAVRKKAMEEMRRLMLKRSGQPNPFVVQVEMKESTEKISGNWTKDGAEGKYTLKSLGKGRYKLSAESTDPEGTVTKYDDEGTMAELRAKYPFLKHSDGIIMIGKGGAGWPRMAFTSRSGGLSPNAPNFKYVKSLGVLVRRPSKDLEYHLKLPVDTTWIVESVTKKLKGDKLGLRRFDLITGADGEDLTELAPLEKAQKNLSIVRRSKPVRIALAKADDKEK